MKSLNKNLKLAADKKDEHGIIVIGIDYFESSKMVWMVITKGISKI